MVLFNYSTRELTAKIVYYGPGLCGKTTNLQQIYEGLPQNVKGKMLSLATKTDRTLFFDFLPIDLGEIRGMKTRVQLYTVPGQVFYNETRRLVLKGADGVVFVADSQPAMMDANLDSLRNLEENLRAHGMDLKEMPLILQYNKRDLASVSSIEEMNAKLNGFSAPFYESVATTGLGVQESLKAITKLVLLNLTRKYDSKGASAGSPARPAAGRPQPPPRPPGPTVVAPVAPVAPASAAAQAGIAPGAELGGLRDNEVVELIDEVKEDTPRKSPPPVPTPAAPATEGELELDHSVAAAGEYEPEGHRRTAAPTVPSLPGRGPMAVPPVAGGDGAAIPARVVQPQRTPAAGLSLTEVSSDDSLFQDDDLEIAILRPSEQKEILVPVQIEVEGKVLHYRLALRLSLDGVNR